MINHARTLLLNKRAVDVAAVADCYHVPAGYLPLTLSPTLLELRSLLLPPGMHVTGEVYLIDMLLQLLHMPELEPFTLLFDPRVTYAEPTTNLAELAEPRVTVAFSTQVACDMTPRYRYLTSTYSAPLMQAGAHAWRINYVDAYTLQVVPTRGLPSQHTVLGLDTVTRTQLFPLVPRYLSGYLEVPSGVLVPGFALTYSTFLAPIYNIGERVDAIERWLGRTGNYQALFGGARATGLLHEMQTVWGRSSETTLRLGALLLALVYQLDRQWRVT